MKNIVLLFGGESVEHDISILTALNFSKNYMGDNRLCNLYISKNGEWFFCAKRIDKSMFGEKLSSDYQPWRKPIFEALSAIPPRNEDGTINMKAVADKLGWQFLKQTVHWGEYGYPEHCI